MTFKALMQQLKAAKNPLECITVEFDAMAAARREASPHKNATSSLLKVG